MAYLTKETILETEDLPAEEMDVPEWGGTVRLRTLTGEQRDRYELAVSRANKTDPAGGMVNFRARLVAAVLVDESGRPLFQPEDVAALGRKNAAALNRLFDKAQQMNGFTRRDVDELEKNSGSARSG